MGLRQLWSVDTRGLAVFRLGLAGLILFDLSIRGGDLAAHYTDAGILPRSVQLLKFAGPWEFSLYWMNGNTWLVTAFFLLQALVAILLGLGYRTRLMTMVSWFMLVSLQNRNPMVMHSGDVLFRMLLFWSMFLPLGDRYSVDAALDPMPEQRPPTLLSVAGVAIIAQIFMEYVFAAMSKQGPEWLGTGTAVLYALHVEQFTTSAGLWLRQFTAMLTAMTYFVWYFELLGPFLFFVPWRFPWWRLLSMAIFASLHLGFSLFLGIGIFPYICLVGLIPLLPTPVWEWVSASKILRRGHAVTSIYANPDRALAWRGLLILREFLLLRSVPVQGVTREEGREAGHAWWLEDDKGEAHHAWDALVMLVAASPLVFFLAPALRTRPVSAVGRWWQRVLAKHGARLDLSLSSPLVTRRYSMSPLATLVLGLLLVYVLLWNIGTIKGARWQLPSSLNWVAYSMRLDQRWNMFSVPITQDGWFVIRGKLADGRPYDVYRQKLGPVDEGRPALISATFPNERWQKYMMNMAMKSNADHRLYFGQYLCRKLNEGHAGPDLLESFDIIFMSEDISVAGQRGKAEPVLLWQHRCY